MYKRFLSVGSPHVVYVGHHAGRIQNLMTSLCLDTSDKFIVPSLQDIMTCYFICMIVK